MDTRILRQRDRCPGRQGGLPVAVTWARFQAADPALAASVRERFESHRHAVMATLRGDGAPRLSGMEVPIRDGHLWLAMDATSRKTADLLRDPRFSMHSAPDAEDLRRGDARVEGRAIPADRTEISQFLKGHRFPVDDTSTMTLFTTDITRVVLARVEDRRLLVMSWTPEAGVKRILV